MTIEDLIADYRSVAEFAVLLDGRRVLGHKDAVEAGRSFKASWFAAQQIINAAGGIENVSDKTMRSSDRPELHHLSNALHRCMAAMRELAEHEYFEITWRNEQEHAEFAGQILRLDNSNIIAHCEQQLKQLQAQFKREDDAIAQLAADRAQAQAQAAAVAEAKAARLKQPSLLMVKTGRLLPTRRHGIALLIRMSQQSKSLPDIISTLRAFGMPPETVINDTLHFFPQHCSYTGEAFRFNLLENFMDDFEIREVAV